MDKSSEFITEEIILKAINSKGVIKDFKVENLCGEGENYAADIKNVIVDFTDEASKAERKVHMIFKYPNKTSFMYGNVKLLNGYQKEVIFYGILAADIHNWQKECFGEVKYLMPIPNCFYANEETELMVIENLKVKEYKMLPRQSGRSFKECALVMKTLAVFHALLQSYSKSFESEHAFFEKYPCYKTVPFEQWEVFFGNPTMVDNRQSMFKTIIGSLKKNYPEDEELLNDFHSHIQSTPYAKNSRYFYLDGDGVNIICHGDMWSNNVMFKKDENGEVVDAKLIDLQIVKYATPAADLCHFIWVSGSIDVLNNHMNKLVEIYYDQFSSCLSDLKCAVPLSFEELLEKFRGLYCVGLESACLATAVTFQSEENSMTTESEDDNKDMMENLSIKMEKLVTNASENVKTRMIELTRLARQLNIF